MRKQAADTATTELLVPRWEGGSTAIHLVAGAPGRSQEGRICTAAPPSPAQPGLGGITTEQRRGAEEQREFEGNTKLLFLRQQVQAAGQGCPSLLAGSRDC